MKNKRQITKAPLAQFIAVIALSISIFLIVDLGRRAAANYRTQREAERLGQEVEAAKQYQSKLLAQRTYAASDLYVEEVARRELKWAKPGETLVVVLPTYEETTLSPGKADVTKTPFVAKTPDQAWWQLFFGDMPPSRGSP
ncbi:MAG: septum formation initiator family protein [Anaerolineae bacterium]|nr:septum formation initiator family protein [Anaerolineae bacterium]